MKGRLKYYLFGLLAVVVIILYSRYGQDDLVRLVKLHHVNRLIVTNNETGKNFEIRSTDLADYFGHTYSRKKNSGYKTDEWEEPWKVDYYADNELLFKGAIIRHLRSDVDPAKKDDVRYEDYYYMYRVDVSWLLTTRPNYSQIDFELIEQMVESDIN